VSDDLHRPTTAGPVPPAGATAQPTQSTQEQSAPQQAQAKVADAASTAQEKVGQAQAKVADTASTAQAKASDLQATAQAKASDLQATAQAKVATAQAAASERPEVQVGLAFAGGFLAALILKRLTR
jgi:ElaB/YqjD/DUF883 family membrane-anchored ribosome-binding protein